MAKGVRFNASKKADGKAPFHHDLEVWNGLPRFMGYLRREDGSQEF